MLLDTHAWVNVLNKAPDGLKIREIAEGHAIETAMASISELTSWALRNGVEPKKVIEEVTQASTVIPLSQETSELAGHIHFNQKRKVRDFGMVDAMIYATALVHGAELITGDPHFKDLPQVLFIE